jgi:branched-chain amino acid transport system substrate-binding protein
VTVANQLISQDMYGLIGPIFSSVTLPVSEVTERENIPSFNASSATDVTERDLNAVFRMAFRDDQAGPFDAQTALETMGAQTAVVIHDNSSFALGLGEAFAEAFEEGGGEVLAIEVINPGESDYSSTLTRVRDLDPDAVYYSGYFAEGGLLVRQGKELGIEGEGPGTGWIFGNSNFDPSFIEIGGEAAEGVLLGTWPSPQVDPAMAEYAEKYTEEFGEEPGTLGHWAYDALYVLCEAIQQAGTTDQQAVIDVLHSDEFEYEGVSGPIAYDEKGDRSFPPLAVLTVQDGEFAIYEGS